MKIQLIAIGALCVAAVGCSSHQHSHSATHRAVEPIAVHTPDAKIDVAPLDSQTQKRNLEARIEYLERSIAAYKRDLEMVREENMRLKAANKDAPLANNERSPATKAQDSSEMDRTTARILRERDIRVVIER